MNILITCVGKRDYLVRWFKEALGSRGEVVAANSIAETTGMMAADYAYVVPPILDENYIEALLIICRKHQIKMICSLYDLDVLTLAYSQSKFSDEGILFVGPSIKTAEETFDKLGTLGFSKRLGIKHPKTFSSYEAAKAAIQAGELTFPVVIKPRFGMATIGVEIAQDHMEMDLIWRLIQYRIDAQRNKRLQINGSSDFIFQEFLNGVEYGIDVLKDFKGEFVAAFAKKKLQRSGGETDMAVTCNDSEIVAMARNISDNTECIGPIDIDLIDTPNGLYFLEVNPRFGGMYPFSHMAGANIPGILISWLHNTPTKSTWFSIRDNNASIKGYQLHECSNTFQNMKYVQVLNQEEKNRVGSSKV